MWSGTFIIPQQLRYLTPKVQYGEAFDMLSEQVVHSLLYDLTIVLKDGT